MKLIIFFITFFSYLAYSQDFKLIGPPGGAVLKLKAHQTIQDKIFAAPYGGNLFSTDDGGITNNYFNLKMGSYRINEINTFNEDIYLRSFKYILRSTNAGSDWIIDSLSSSLSCKILINPLNPSTLYITNAQKEIWKSYDKGENWFLLKSFNYGLRGIALAKTDSSVLYVGADFTIYKSTNAGTDWFRTLDSSVVIDIYQLEVNPLNENSLYFWDFYNNLYKSEDGGTSIRQINTYYTSGFAVHPFDTLTIYSHFGSPGPSLGISKTTDEGLSWFLVNTGLPPNPAPSSLEIDPLNPEILYSGIWANGVFKSTNGGNNWFLTNLSYSSALSIWVHQTDFIDVGVYGWGIMRTSNLGEDWIHPSFSPNIFQVITPYDITYNPYDRTKGFLAGNNYLWKTTDGGESWQCTFELPGARSVAFKPSNPDIVFASRSTSPGSSFLYRSTDSGQTWNMILNTSQAYDAGVSSFYFDPVDTGIIYGVGSGMILKSTDGGLTWEKKENGLITSGSYLSSISDFAIKLNEPNILYCSQRAIGTGKGYLYKSTNGGENWFHIDSTLHLMDPYASISSILIDNEKPGRLFVGMNHHGQALTPNYSNGGLNLTEDDGKTWRKVYDSEVTLIKSDDNNPRNLYFSSKFGLMTFLDTLTVTSVKDEKDLMNVTDYKLHQNYPNPFNPSTVIGYQLPVSGNVTLKVFDVLGREVATLVNEYKEAGKHSVEFNAGGLPSGVYFYRLNAGSFSETKKMILLR